MRELHVVAVSEDGRHVLLAGKRGAAKGGFRVALDDRLTAAVRGDLRQPGTDAPVESDLSPKEIQARLRSGESVASIAHAAGVPVARVERFSGPVQGEMARIIDAARAGFVVRGRLGRSAVALGPAVDLAISLAPSLREDSAEWTTRRLEDGSWIVTVTWFARKRSREASWRFNPIGKELVAVDPASAALAHRDTPLPIAPRRAAAGTVSPVAAATVKKPPAKKAVARKAPAKKVAAKKAPTRAPAAKAPIKKAATKQALAKAVPAKKATARATAVAKKAPAKKAPAKKAAVKRVVATRAPAAKPPVTKVAPPAKARLRVVPDPAPAKRTSSADRDGVKTRATVPGWADVLLGTAPGGDR